MGNYQSLNVLANPTRKNDLMSDDAITEVANMINTSGANRKQRRRIEKSLNKMENILSHAQAHVDRSAYKHYQEAVDMNYVHFFACLGMTMIEDYHWKEDDTHDQISSLLVRVGKKIDKLASMGYDTDGVVKLLEEHTGIVLVPDTHPEVFDGD